MALSGERSRRIEYESQLRARQRLVEIETTRALLQEFEDSHTVVHRRDFADAAPPTAPERSVDGRALRREERKRELEGISWFARAERKAAKQRADARAEERTLAAEAEAALERESLQRRLDAEWEALLANDPARVLEALEAAFESAAVPATAVDCRGSAVSVVMQMLPRDGLVPEMQTDVTPGGKPTLKKMSQTLRNELHAAAVASHALASARAALAAAPSVDSVALLAVIADKASVAPVYVALFQRQQLATIDWSEDAATISARLDGWMQTKGQARELAPLPLGGEPDLLAVVSQVAAAIGLPLDPAAERAK